MNRLVSKPNGLRDHYNHVSLWLLDEVRCHYINVVKIGSETILASSRHLVRPCVSISWVTNVLTQVYFWCEQLHLNSMKLVIPLHFISWKNSFSDISRKCILPNMIYFVKYTSCWYQKIFFHEIKCNRMTSFMEFMLQPMQKRNSSG